MPYIYHESSGKREYVLPSFSIDTTTMQLVATQDENDPVSFLINDDGELTMEV